jgi:tetratricopeptide (TPR) repeat protein
VNAEEILAAALERTTPAERAAYLDAACGQDAVLRNRVVGLLQAHEKAGSFLEGPLFNTPTVDTAPNPEQPGSVIGPYKLIQEIGEGGMGNVWMVQQTEPVKRLVALKVIKPGMDSKQVLARFEAERQALALMDHPNIARVLDAGATPTGRPYFVMELVKGVPITQYCDEHRLTPKERLELFVPVCQAIQHAHQKGIIHRDIKPSNVLIALYDGKPVPKVIDFGIAKATGQQLTAQTLVTGFGAVVGTLEYMSPEQAELNQLDIDTRSDIYSLGVLLYELLTSSTPLEKKRLKETAMLEVLRIIREEEPPRPSTRLAESKDTLPTISARRQTEPARLTRLVRGELDWIVMKCLEKDRNRRYETANGLARDIERYLHDEPVQACPPSAWYRFRKFARRNRTAVVVTALLLLFIALLGGGGGWVMRDRAARQAEKSNNLERTLDRADFFLGLGKRPEAQAALEQARMLADQAPADPSRDERLAALEERLAAEVRDQQFMARYEQIRLEVQSRFNVEASRFSHSGLPEITDALGRYGITVGVMAPAEAAACIKGRPEAVRHALVAALYECLFMTWRKELQKGQWLLTTIAAADKDAWRVRVREVLASGDAKALEQRAREADVSQQPPSFLVVLADSLPRQAGAVRLELLRRTQRAYPADLWANHHLGFELANNGRPAEAVRYYTAALSLRPDNPVNYLNRGTALYRAGELDQAIADYRHCLVLAPAFPAAHSNLGLALYKQGKLDEAIAECRKAIEFDPKYALAYSTLGTTLYKQGKVEEAIAALCKALDLDPKDATAHSNLGLALAEQGKLGQAIAEFRKAIDLDPKDAEAHSNLGAALAEQGKLDEAIAEYRQAIKLDPKFAPTHYNLGIDLGKMGRLDEAIAALRKALDLDPKYAPTHYNLGLALAKQGKLDEAIAAYRKAIDIDPKWSAPHNNLGLALAMQGKLDEAIAEYRKAIKLDPNYAKAHRNLGRALSAKGQLDEAIAAFRKAIALEPKNALAHCCLGLALLDQGKLDEGAAECRKAVELAPADSGCQQALGWALCRVGAWKDSIEAFHKSMDLQKHPKGGDPGQWFGLAVAHWNLGDKTEARRWYDRAVRWMEKHAPENWEFRRYRAQAEKVLGVKGKR